MESNIQKSKSKPNPIEAFFVNNPWLGAFGALAGIIGIPLAIYLYFAGKEAPDIRYYVNPVRTAIVKAGVDSNFSILYKDQQIPDDVTSVSVAIWNAGTRPIRKDDVLEPIQIHVELTHGILEAKLVSTTRSVVGLDLDKSKLSDGTVGVQFKILEHNDGGILQLLYRGDSNVRISAQGSVIGQSSLDPLVYSGKSLRSLPDQMRSNRRYTWVQILMALLVVGLNCSVLYFGNKKPKVLVVLASILILSLIVLVSYEWYSEIYLAPPFDFG